MYALAKHFKDQIRVSEILSSLTWHLWLCTPLYTSYRKQWRIWLTVCPPTLLLFSYHTSAYFGTSAYLTCPSFALPWSNNIHLNEYTCRFSWKYVYALGFFKIECEFQLSLHHVPFNNTSTIRNPQVKHILTFISVNYANWITWKFRTFVYFICLGVRLMRKVTYLSHADQLHDIGPRFGNKWPVSLPSLDLLSAPDSSSPCELVVRSLGMKEWRLIISIAVK